MKRFIFGIRSRAAGILRALAGAGSIFRKGNRWPRLVIVVAAGFICLSCFPSFKSFSDTLRTETVESGVTKNDGRPLVIGFYVNWDAKSFNSLSDNIQNLDWVVPSWLFLLGENMELKPSLDLKALDLMRSEKPGIAILAMIQNASANTWDGGNLARFLANPVKRHERVDEIARFIEANNLQGTVIDFEQIPRTAQRDMIAFIGEIHAAFQARGWLVAVAAPFDDPDWDYRSYAGACDYVVLMGYDEHWSSGRPGPIASQSWFSTRLGARMRSLDPARTIVAIGNYGYDWKVGGDKADEMTFDQVMQRAGDKDAAIELEPLTLNPRFSYDEDGKAHRVWFLNAVSATHQMRAADRYRPAGYALWRLGGEDPSIWSVLPHSYNSLRPAVTPPNEGDHPVRGE